MPSKEEIKLPPAPPKKESPLERVKKKKVKEEVVKTDYADLIEDANTAKLEQEISKAETMKYKAEQERLKLKRAAGEVMEFDKGDLLFFGFIDKASFEILRVMDKFEPVIKNLTAENDYKKIILTVNRELENILVNIQEEQATTVNNWQKSLK
jgi:hypothetical protein